MKKYIIKKMKISDGVYDQYMLIIKREMGAYDKDKTYCGPGKVGDRLVPDLMFGYAGYCHDGLVSSIQSKENEVDKYHADLFFYWIMRYIAGWNPVKVSLAWIYYKSVDKFGDY